LPLKFKEIKEEKKEVEDKKVFKWKCTVCGEIVEGEEPPEKCPVCGVGPKYFIKVEETEEEETSDDKENIVIIGASGAGMGAAIDIIPPSITMITYAVASGTSVGALFMGGIIPGLLIAILLMITVGIKVKREKIAEKKEFNIKKLGKAFVDAVPALMVPIIILGGMFSGMFTATESGAIACLYGFLVGVFYYKELNRDNIFEIIGGAITNTVLVMLIVGVSGAFSWMLTTSGASNMLSRLLGDFATNKYVFLLLSNIIFIFLGMFIESVAAILIVTPIMHPIAMSLGINPVHYGIIMVTNLAIGLCTPPVGENQYIVSAIADIPFEQEVKASFPFVMVAFLGLFIITYIPDIVMFLPNLLGY
jgi:C4-dicarboxylate transporter DctM subunit